MIVPEGKKASIMKKQSRLPVLRAQFLYVTKGLEEHSP